MTTVIRMLTYRLKRMGDNQSREDSTIEDRQEKDEKFVRSFFQLDSNDAIPTSCELYVVMRASRCFPTTNDVRFICLLIQKRACVAFLLVRQ